MKRVVLGLSVLLGVVAWLTPEPIEQPLAPEAARAEVNDPSIGLVLSEVESDLVPGVLTDAERDTPIASPASMPIR